MPRAGAVPCDHVRVFKFPAPNSNLRVVATSLGINLKTAKALSLNIPDKRLALADEVLQPDPSCRLPMVVSGVQIAAAVRPTAATTTLSVPARSVTVNITVNVGGSH